LTRVPGLVRPWFERDEAYIGVQAAALRRGEQLYVDVVDRKPPLAPVVYAVVSAVFGADFRPIRFLLVLWVAATAALVIALVVRLGASRRAAVVAGVLYELGTVAFVPRDGQGANYELWAVLFAQVRMNFCGELGPLLGSVQAPTLVLPAWMDVKRGGRAASGEANLS
jgi:hypothetical protein